MPIYSFKCLKCERVYDEIAPHDPTGKFRKVRCPSCDSKNKERYYPGEVRDWDCGDKRERFGYRAGVNMEKAKAERRAAESKSHMGTNPYNSRKLD